MKTNHFFCIIIVLSTDAMDATDKAEYPLNTVVPEHTQSAKFASNSGVHGIIYVTKEKQPRRIKIKMKF